MYHVVLLAIQDGEKRVNEQASKRDMIKIQSRLPFVHRSEIKKYRNKK